MTALNLPVLVLGTAVQGRRPNDGNFRALNPREFFVNTYDQVLCYLTRAGSMVTFQLNPTLYAMLASPALTGTPTAPTPAAGDNSTKLATTAFVAALVAAYAPLASPAFTGAPTAPTAAALTNSTQVATTAYADKAVAAATARTAVSSGNYAAAVTDRLIAYTALAAASTVTLPPPGSSPKGTSLTLVDEKGTATGTITLTLAPNGAEKIIGASSYVIAAAYGYVQVETDGTNWTIIDSNAFSSSALGSSTPNMDGTGSAGSASTAARSDHTHPTDTSRAAVALTGDAPYNMMLSASVASNALTISVLTAAGAAPTAASPVVIPFRDNARTTGDLVFVSITSALSITVPSGATLGTASGKPCRLWVVAIDNGGSPVLGLKVCTDGATTIYPLAEGADQSATAIGTGSTSPGVLYASAAVSGGSVRVLGCVEFAAGQATAGTWASSPSAVLRQLSGGKRPGDVVQVASLATTTPSNNNVNAYGAFPFNVTVTPTSAINAVDVSCCGGDLYVSAAGVLGYLRIARGNSAAGATVAEMASGISGSGSIQSAASLRGLDFPATASATVYALQIRNSDNATNIVFPQAGKPTLLAAEIMT